MDRISPDIKLIGTIAATLFCCFLVLAVLMKWLPMAVPVICLAASGITFGAYAYDKSAAESGQWRTKESTLHWFAFLGGWPGAAFAQKNTTPQIKENGIPNNVLDGGCSQLLCAGINLHIDGHIKVAILVDRFSY